jgi:cysteinyl-tRNA synthetase
LFLLVYYLIYQGHITTYHSVTILFFSLIFSKNTMTQLKLYNSLTRSKELIEEQLPIGMYVCGPTVYSRPHIGNARSCVVYDVLFRLLKNIYGDDSVIYVRNITDVDDKINAAAIERGISIQALTAEVIQHFHDDIAEIGCLQPTIEPKVTSHIAEIIQMIERLIANGHAYVASGHVLFDVMTNAHNGWNYGMLSGRQIEEQEAGARIAVESYKRNTGDFVLWKPASSNDDVSSVFASPWGNGRPGWHIECSAMSTRYLGEDFAIHGGGADLKFPHHENEIAQSCCANHGSSYARTWVHNGFLTVNGEKMSKSLGNFITVHDLLQKGVRGEVIRFALLAAHYAKPLDWNNKLLEDSLKQLNKLYKNMNGVVQLTTPNKAVIQALCDDLNLPKAIACLHNLPANELKASGALLGLLQDNSEKWLAAETSQLSLTVSEIEGLIEQRVQAKQSKNWAEADRIREYLLQNGVELVDQAGGSTIWR